jgi:predicted N-acyltransferase
MAKTLDFEIKILHSLSEVEPLQWDALQEPGFPFADYSFLRSQEITECLGSRTGWTPVYLSAWIKKELAGVLILFLKTNSYGEYIFDFNWAQAYESSRLRYYPKLVSAIPFTPATGSKLLIRSSLEPQTQNQIFQSLLENSKELVKKLGASSLHFLFIPEKDLARYKDQGLFIRHSFQYHWQNQNYRSFDEFLTKLRGKRRREIARERSQVVAQGVTLKSFTQNELTPHHAEVMYLFYRSTIDKMEGFDYLTEDFFKEVFKTMKDKILLVLAYDQEGREVAGALNFYSRSTLFGRYWGCLAEYKALHFEVCYYQGIEFCIQNKLSLFEAGAQGEHKFQRGFLPTLTYSAHHIEHPLLNHAIQDFVTHEKKHIEELFGEYKEHSPYQNSSM